MNTSIHRYTDSPSLTHSLLYEYMNQYIMEKDPWAVRYFVTRTLSTSLPSSLPHS